MSDKSIIALAVFLTILFPVLLLWLLHGLVEAMRASGGY